MSSWGGRRRILFAYAWLVLFAMSAFLWQPCFFMEGKDGPLAVVPLWKDMPFSIRFIHSVQRTPVLENLVARADGSGFELLSTKYRSFGVGLPFLESEGEFRMEGDDYVFDRMGRRFPDLSLRTGAGTKLTVQVPGRAYPLHEMFPPGTKVDLFVAPFLEGYLRAGR